jgi:hypothetical protein
MSTHAKKGLLPEGGEMLILAICMFLGVVGVIFLMSQLAPNVNWDTFIAH